MNTFNFDTYLSEFNELLELRDLTKNTAKNMVNLLKVFTKVISLKKSCFHF